MAAHRRQRGQVLFARRHHVSPFEPLLALEVHGLLEKHQRAGTQPAFSRQFKS